MIRNKEFINYTFDSTKILLEQSKLLCEISEWIGTILP